MITQQFVVQGKNSPASDTWQLWLVSVDNNGAATYQKLANTYGSAAGNGSADHFATLGSNLLFSADGSVAPYTSGNGNGSPPSNGGTDVGTELWTTSASPGSATLVDNIFPGVQPKAPSPPNSSEPSNFAVVGSSMFFTANYETVAQQTSSQPSAAGLWVTDGTTNNTYEIYTEVNDQKSILSPSEIVQLGNSALIEGTSSSTPTSLWITNGSAINTTVNPGPTLTASLIVTPPKNYVLSDLTVINAAGGTQEAFFVESLPKKGAYISGPTEGTGHLDQYDASSLWVTNGTASGTHQVGSVYNGPQASSALPAISDITAFGTGDVLFAAYSKADQGYDLFSATAAGVTQITTTAINPKFITPFTAADGTLEAVFENGTNNTTGYQLYLLKGNTVSKLDNADGTAALGTPSDELFALGNQVFFSAFVPGDSYPVLWVTDGTQTGTKAFAPAGATVPQYGYFLRESGGEVFFENQGGNGPYYVGDTNGTTVNDFKKITDDKYDLRHLVADPFPLPCFLAGTRLRAASGADVLVEDLREGDLLRTHGGAAAPVRWIGQRRVDCRRHPEPEKVWPVRVRAGAFGRNRPRRDLLLSPDHAVFARGVLIPVKQLVNGDSIAQQSVDHAQYFHVELPVHDIVLAEELPVESFLDAGNKLAFANAGVAIALHPDFTALAWETACAPLALVGPQVNAVRASLRARTRPARAA
jgi:hypothetical protein